MKKCLIISYKVQSPLLIRALKGPQKVSILIGVCIIKRVSVKQGLSDCTGFSSSFTLGGRFSFWLQNIYIHSSFLAIYYTLVFLCM